MKKINEKKSELQKEAFELLKLYNFRGAIILATGVGKSKIIIDSLNYLSDCESILYCCDNTLLRDSGFPNELKEWNSEHLLDKMTRLCYQSAFKLKDEYYDILVCDEGDFMLSPSYVRLLENNTFKYIIFVSATLEPAKKEMLERYIPVIYEKKIKDIEGQGIVNRSKFFYVPYMLTNKENKDYLFINAKFTKLLSDEKPNNFLLNRLKTTRKHFLAGLKSSEEICKKLIKKIETRSKNKTLIFCTLGSQADKVCKHSHHQGNNNPHFLDLLNSGDIKSLAVVGKIDRGINLIGVNCIVLEAPFNSVTKSTQKTGRARRLDVDECSYIFYLIPYYKNNRNETTPTIALKWMYDSCKDLNPNFKIYNI